MDETVTSKTCTNCKESKFVTNFHRKRGTYAAQCKDCINGKIQSNVCRLCTKTPAVVGCELCQSCGGGPRCQHLVSESVLCGIGTLRPHDFCTTHTRDASHICQVITNDNVCGTILKSGFSICNVHGKKCCRCHVFKLLDDFKKDKSIKSGLYGRCKQCDKVKNT